MSENPRGGRARRPLDGYRVLDFSRNVAGPLAGQILADLGAEVIKVEPPRGEAARHIVDTTSSEGLAPYFLPYNRGKRSLVADLHTPEGVEQILSLVQTTDVFLDGFRPGTMEKWGLGREAIRAINPKCVYASLSAYGGNGDNGQRPGVDLLVQAESGVLTGLRTDAGVPLRIPFTFIDSATGHVLAQAILAALLHRARHDEVTDVRVAMYDVAASMQANELTSIVNAPPASSKTASGGAEMTVAKSPGGIYPASDGFIVFAAYIPKHWQQFVRTLGIEHLAADPRFADQVSRGVNDAHLRRELEAVFAAHSASELVELLRAAGLMAGEVKSREQATNSDLFAENELTVTVTDGKRVETTIRTPARYSAFSPAAQAPTPTLGEYLPNSGPV
ncbi:CaiB/BaiF CoA transferase family protein [Rhodococcus sp. ACT016]|uniref:CaiB/BaiF CoA transferase family protein n=1 Tax=Rhodococcus sp. ACT016 TaxID=3134808 RepID=UPI003D2C17FC